MGVWKKCKSEFVDILRFASNNNPEKPFSQELILSIDKLIVPRRILTEVLMRALEEMMSLDPCSLFMDEVSLILFSYMLLS